MGLLRHHDYPNAFKVKVTAAKISTIRRVLSLNFRLLAQDYVLAVHFQPYVPGWCSGVNALFLLFDNPSGAHQDEELSHYGHGPIGRTSCLDKAKENSYKILFGKHLHVYSYYMWPTPSNIR